MTGQMGEIIAMDIANEVRENGGDEIQMREFFRKTEFDAAVKKELRRFARRIIRLSGGTPNRKRELK